MAQTVDFYQIIFKASQRNNLYPFAKEYFNQTLTPFFENSVIKEVVLKSEADKIGVVSHALKQKMRLNLRPLTLEVLNEDFDVLSFTRNSKFHKMIPAAEAWHPGFSDLLEDIMGMIGYSIRKVPKYPIYQNAFVAKSHIYKQYVKDFLIPAMTVMETDPKIKKLCWQDSNYTKLKNEPLTDRAKMDLGVGYYPMHPFICERFFSQWLETKNLNVQYL